MQKPTYSVGELATVNHYARQLESLFLCWPELCNGCGRTGQTQSAISCWHKHEFAQRLNFHSTDDDSFLRTLRPKTKVFGEWLLWPEVVEMVRWGIARREKIRGFGSDALLIVSEHGKPWYDEAASKSPQAKYANVWNDLIRRVRKNNEHKDFRYLPFGTLRDTLPDVIRHRYSDELASLCVAHGSTFKGDKLLDCYTNKPFGRLHQAIGELHDYFCSRICCRPFGPHGKTEAMLCQCRDAGIKSAVDHP